MWNAKQKEQNTTGRIQQYHKAIRNGEEYDHEKHFHLPEDIMLFIKPIFKDLANPVILHKCLRGKPQNPNESLNNVIWSIIPKRTFVNLVTLKFGAFEAVNCFNNGNIGKCKVLQQIGLTPGKKCVSAMLKLDKRRVTDSDQAALEATKEMRQRRSIAKRRLEDLMEEEEGTETPSYASGMY